MNTTGPLEMSRPISAAGLASMTRRRIIKGLLHNLLGTLASRNSDFDGYWVFGFLVGDMDRERIDLLATRVECTDSAPTAFIKRLAAQKFAEQISKAGLPSTWIREARIELTKSPVARSGIVNGRQCSGHDVRLQAHAVSDLGRTYAATLGIFVAPHDPSVESRSARAN